MNIHPDGLTADGGHLSAGRCGLCGNLLAFLIAAKNESKSICGYGAPGNGNRLLNYCTIGTDFLQFTVDRNPYIPIIDPAEIRQ